MESSNRKVLLIIIGIVVVLALVWFLALRGGGDDQDTAPQEPPAPVPTEEEQTGTDSSAPRTDEPQTALGVEAAAVLASYRDILQIQEQYTDTCPSAATVADVTTRFSQANSDTATLTANLLANDDPQAAEEAQGYMQEINTLIERSAVLGPEIVERCSLEIPA